MSLDEFHNDLPNGKSRRTFLDDFKRFFVRGLAAILPTLITLWLLVWAWDFLWGNLGQYIIIQIRDTWDYAIQHGWLPFKDRQYILLHLNENDLSTRAIGVGLSILLVYIVGVLVGNLIGRAAWRVVERGLLRIPLVRAIYPAVKQVTDFLLVERSQHFQYSRVVAVQPHEQNIWSIGFVTSSGNWTLSSQGEQPMVTVFIPSTPTSFTGYVLIVPREKVVELPMTVEEAMRLLISGGVILPHGQKTAGRNLPAETVAAALANTDT